jgi:hypothetical protein
MTLRQQPLYHDRRIAGFWATVRVGATVEIDDQAWLDALRKGELVGTCRTCGGYLIPGMSYTVGATKWYPGTCRDCRYETAAHGPRPAKNATTKTQNGGLT